MTPGNVRDVRHPMRSPFSTAHSLCTGCLSSITPSLWEMTSAGKNWASQMSRIPPPEAGSPVGRQISVRMSPAVTFKASSPAYRRHPFTLPLAGMAAVVSAYTKFTGSASNVRDHQRLPRNRGLAAWPIHVSTTPSTAHDDPTSHSTDWLNRAATAGSTATASSSCSWIGGVVALAVNCASAAAPVASSVATKPALPSVCVSVWLLPATAARASVTSCSSTIWSRRIVISVAPRT
mmetsp:Transcript_24799/g.62348  ORF Transcript_24799/g.62348 Transcript_24799/m.62348 type:complete len:235 (-) Transcript_24799:415-1119(-)